MDLSLLAVVGVPFALLVALAVTCSSPPASIRLVGLHVLVEARGIARLFAFRRTVRVDLANIRDVQVAPSATAVRPRPWIRTLGTSVPGLLQAGTFRGNGRSFWLVRPSHRVLVLECAGGRFARIVVEVVSPDEAASTITAALEGSRGSRRRQ